MSASGSANGGRGGNSNHRNGEGGGGGRDVKGKGRARGGGGGRGRGGVRRAADYTPAQEPRVAQEAIAEASRVAIEKAQREREQEAAALGVDGEEEEVDTCYICAEPIKYYALGTCSHRTCHVCSLRLRALYKKRECTFCKTDLPSVITTLDSSTPFEDFPPDAFPYSDARLAIAFETSQMMEDTLALLRFNCPQLNCDYLGTGWADLKKHARNDHGLVFCDLCTKHKKIFTHEHTLYTPEQLKSHIRDGDPQPTGAEDDDERTGFTGHPSCEFCRITFYDNDQLFTHCRDKHEQCFLCIQNGTGRYQYYVDYPHLETHFQAAHYLCLNPQCLKDRFVVFDNQIDLQAHQVSVHGEAVPKTARRLETNFSYAPASRDPRAGGGVSMAPKQNAGHNTNHAGASSSSAAVPSSSNHTEAPTPAQSSSTSNGRNRIIPGLQRGGFKTNLSEPESSRKNDKKSAQTSTMGDSITGVKQNDPLMASRHSSLLSRFSDAVNGNSTKVDAYRAAIRSYRTSESSANDVIGTIHSLLDNQLDVTGRIVTDTADLLDSEEKRRALFDAWDEYSRTATSSVDAFPSLVPTAPVATQSGSRFTAARQARTFMPRSAKQTSSAVWDRVAEAAANKNVGSVPGLTRAAQQSKEKFPALPSAAHAVSKTAGPRGATPWASHKSQTTLPASTYFPVASSASIALMPSGQKSAAGSRPASRPTTSSAREFPDLPQAAPPKARAYFSRSGEATPNRWADGSISPGAELAEAIQRSLDDVQISNTRQTSNSTEASQPSGKKKKGKQLLFQYGL